MVDKPDTTNRCEIVGVAVHSGGSTYYCETHGCVMRTGVGVPAPVVCDCAIQEAENES
jgi:hypothetical protein